MVAEIRTAQHRVTRKPAASFPDWKMANYQSVLAELAGQPLPDLVTLVQQAQSIKPPLAGSAPPPMSQEATPTPPRVPNGIMSAQETSPRRQQQPPLAQTSPQQPQATLMPPPSGPPSRPPVAFAPSSQSVSPARSTTAATIGRPPTVMDGDDTDNISDNMSHLSMEGTHVIIYNMIEL